MTDSASQSLVERLNAAWRDEKSVSTYARLCRNAAARITKLEAELWRVKNDLANANDHYHEVSTRLAGELDVSNNNHRAMAHQMAELGARCKHAESELSRVEGETIERCANFLAREYPDNANTNAFCAAIRSVPPLAKRGDQESPSKQTRRERE